MALLFSVPLKSNEIKRMSPGVGMQEAKAVIAKRSISAVFPLDKVG